MLLCFAWLCVRLVPFRIASRLLGRPESAAQLPIACAETDKTGQAQALNVKTALKSASARLPWISTCLMQVLAGRLMLAHRGVASQTYFGVQRHLASDEFKAHAWLCSAIIDVAGGALADNYHPIATFIAGPSTNTRRP